VEKTVTKPKEKRIKHDRDSPTKLMFPLARSRSQQNMSNRRSRMKDKDPLKQEEESKH